MYVVDACHAAQRVLAEGEPDATELLRLQQLLEREETHPAFLVMMRGERAGLHAMLEQLESGVITFADASDYGTTGNKHIDPKEERLRDGSLQQHPAMLVTLNDAVHIAALPPSERHREALRFSATAPRPARALWQLYFVDTFEGTASWDHLRTAELRCTIGALAAERYRREYGDWPRTLTDLAPHYLATVPLDPEDDEPLGYRRYPDRVVIFSRARRTGGFLEKSPVFDPEKPTPGEGIAFHLWDVSQRRQPFAEILPPPTRDDKDLP